MTKPAPGPRLKFIDMARSIAILMMLEGHFVDVTLADVYRNSGPLFSFWHHFRGLAAPMFFCSTGLVFVYLLTSAEGPDLFKLPRVRKGIVRSLELLFWGYLLQIDLRRLPEYLRGNFEPWMSAFHVLQCIGIGILILIAIFGIQRGIPRIPLPACYVTVGISLLLLHSYLRNLPAATFVPASAPVLLQNPIHGPVSIFPIAPWLIFTLYGGAYGALLRKHRDQVRQPWLPAAIIATGIALKYGGPFLDRALTGTLGLIAARPWVLDDWVHDRAGEITTLLGILVFVENRFPIRDSWFLKVGQNTLPIYVLHVIILYNGIFGYGLKSYIDRAFNPWQAAAGAIAFMASFAVLAVLLERYKRSKQAPVTSTTPGAAAPPA